MARSIAVNVGYPKILSDGVIVLGNEAEVIQQICLADDLKRTAGFSWVGVDRKKQETFEKDPCLNRNAKRPLKNKKIT